jgi:alkylhydroperoxidase family enzyme
MPRIPYFDAAKLPADKQRGRAPNLVRLLMNSPGAEDVLTHMVRFLRTESRLDKRLCELAILQVGWLAQSPYEFAHHVEVAQHVGVSDEDIRAIADETDGRSTHLDELARAVLRAAREMTLDIDLTDATAAVLKRSLDDEQFLDLLVAIASYNGVVRLLSAMRIDVEEEYKRYLDEFPFTRA